jgi:hypothetical protein
VCRSALSCASALCGPLRGASARRAVDEALSSLARRACVSLAAPCSAAATARFGAAHHHAASLREHDATRAVAAACAARLSVAAGAQRAWAASALSALPSPSAAAWALSPGCAPPVDASLALLSQVFGVAHTLARTARQRTLSANGCLAPAEAISFDEGDAGVDAALQFLARAASLLAHARACATADAYIAAADAVLAACASFVAGIAEAYARRSAWTEAALRTQTALAEAAAPQRRYVFMADESMRLTNMLARANIAIV